MRHGSLACSLRLKEMDLFVIYSYSHSYLTILNSDLNCKTAHRTHIPEMTSASTSMVGNYVSMSYKNA
jgi:hypothetical protein